MSSPLAHAQRNASTRPHRTAFTGVVTAARGAPVLDGRADEPAWAHATPTPLFVQRSPAVGHPAAHPARARVLYDDDALYVAFDCPTARRPAAQLGRRDSIPMGEWARVLIDSRGEGVTTNVFAVNPAGVVGDGIASGDGDFDWTWDALWDAAVAQTDHGWTAELRIPWSVLRFDAHHPVIRIQFERFEFDDGETQALVPIPPDAQHFVGQFATLAGVSDLNAPRTFQITPYTLGRLRLLRDPSLLDPTDTFSGNVGADIKLGITNDLTLDVAINPDFGQVEVDPTVVNLTTYEVFFPERRPFFLEGIDLFRTPLLLLHTRRIGAAPPVPGILNPNGSIIAVDPLASIMGATKVSGRIGPMSFMVLDGVTSAANATEQSTTPSGRTVSQQRIAVPVTNWFAARARGTIASGSIVGATVTHVARFGLHQGDDAVGSIDVDVGSPDGRHRIRAQAAASSAWNATQGLHTGEALYVEALRAQDPIWTWSLRMRMFTRDFDPNGLGYLDRPNLLRLTADSTFRSPHPMGVFRSFYVYPFVWRTTNMDGLVIDQGAGVELSMQTRNQWVVGLGGRVSTDSYDDRETRGGIPWFNPANVGAWAWINTDTRGPWRATLYADAANLNGGYRTNVTAGLTFVPASWFSMTASTTAHLVMGVPRWVNNLTESSGEVLSIFGNQNAQIFDNTLRASIAFTPRIGFDLYSQLLYAAIRYDNYQALITPTVYQSYAYNASASYDRVSLTVNAVARYEFRPGSFATLVLVHRQSIAPSDGQVGYGEGLGLLALTTPDTLVLGKLTYVFR